MLHLGTHMLCGKVAEQGVSFTAAAMGAEWSQRGDITSPVSYTPNKRNMTGAQFGDGGTTF